MNDLAYTLKQDRLPALDGLRAAAIALVMASHAPAPFPAGRFPGDLGVTLFFVLSGFLITRLLLREWDATGDLSLRAFLTRRVLRIFPAYYAFLAVWLVAAVLLHKPSEPAHVAAGFTYTVNYYQAITGRAAGLIAHAWSLAVEEQFYLLWPPLLLLLLRRGGPRRAGVLLAAAIVAVGAWRCYLLLGAGAGPVYVYNAFDTRFDALATGCLLAVLLRDPRIVPGVRAIGGSAWMPALTAVAVLAPHVRAPLPFRYGPGFSLDAILCAVLLAQVLAVGGEGAWRVLSWRPVRWIGALSYSLYLYHLLVEQAVLALDIPAWLRLPLWLAASFAVAAASYYAIEKPFLRLKDRFAGGRAARDRASAAAEPALAAAASAGPAA